MRRDVEFDELVSWYSLSTATPDFDPILEDEASEPEMIRAEEEEEFNTLNERPIFFLVDWAK